MWHLKKHWKYKIDDICSKNDDGILKFSHDLHTSIANDSNSFNFLNEPIWFHHMSATFHNILAFDIFQISCRRYMINVPYWAMINGAIQWLPKDIFSTTLINRKCSLGHQEVKSNYFEKKLAVVSLRRWSQKHTF